MNNTAKKLKASGHHLKPVVIIGAQGLSKNVNNEIDAALEAHELIKIRINAPDDETRQDMINTILETHDATLVNQLGHVAVVYRKREE